MIHWRRHHTRPDVQILMGAPQSARHHLFRLERVGPADGLVVGLDISQRKGELRQCGSEARAKTWVAVIVGAHVAPPAPLPRRPPLPPSSPSPSSPQAA